MYSLNVTPQFKRDAIACSSRLAGYFVIIRCCRYCSCLWLFVASYTSAAERR